MFLTWFLVVKTSISRSGCTSSQGNSIKSSVVVEKTVLKKSLNKDAWHAQCLLISLANSFAGFMGRKELFAIVIVNCIIQCHLSLSTLLLKEKEKFIVLLCSKNTVTKCSLIKY